MQSDSWGRTERDMNWLTNVVRPKIRNILRRET
ncbi:MAG: hypothetical protein QOI05_4834, partial [Bradyrhizobium sp.]|nr:hypothetical protein [Bradyrhizobium sp.]